MSKKVLVIVSFVVGLLLVSGGVMVYNNKQGNKEDNEKMAIERKTEDVSMIKNDEGATMEKDKMAIDRDDTAKEDIMSRSGSYVTLADYNANPTKYAGSKKVYFFHASWCSICQDIDKEINTDMSKIPAGVTLIKTDFDKSKDLRQKYGVTTQYTFVQVDNNGNEIAQWSATSLDKAVAGVKS